MSFPTGVRKGKGTRLWLGLIAVAVCLPGMANDVDRIVPSLRLSDSLTGLSGHGDVVAAVEPRLREGLGGQRRKLASQLARVLVEHQLIEAYTADRDVAAGQHGAERSGLFPRVSTRNVSGRQDYASPTLSGARQSGISERSVAVNQLLWDFGATLSGVARAGKQLSIADTELEAQRQNLLYSAIEAVLNLARTAETLNQTRIYEQQLATIAHLENEKILAGRGFATDFEQASSQLELARSRTEAALSSHQSARYRFETVFQEAPGDDFALSVIPDVVDLPDQMEGMLQAVEAGNFDLRTAQLKTDMRREEKAQVVARDFLPRLDLQVERSQQNNVNAVQGVVTSEKASVVASWNFDVGLKANYMVDALTSGIRAEMARAGVTRKQVIEEAKSAWSSWQAAKQRVAHLENQRRHAERFAEFVKIEREFGRRTLLEALNAELSLLNVQGDLVTAMAERKLFAYRIKRAMGTLNLQTLQLAGSPA